ncbi:SIS domain-containing protein [Marinomonas fungiae]|uniref:SIS domain-containing protein n=1 Tax=Marinomonas fungiae TaxID=1137284 RepID=UPI003A91FBFF
MSFCVQYAQQLSQILAVTDWSPVEALAEDCRRLIIEGKRLYICGNGGSAGNAIHLANDYLYGVSPIDAKAIKVEALSANSAVLTCLGNDLGYEHIFSWQLKVKAEPGDVLVVLSGSGNSANILNALEEAKAKGMKSYAILGYQGGKAKALADVPIHFPIDDMQISEDLQLVVGHMLMRLLNDGSHKC